jgi:hypothetical protein
MISNFSLFDPTIDFSFALPDGQTLREQRSCLQRQSSIDCIGYFSCLEENDLHKKRSVKFVDTLVSEVISVPRYEKESISELFYNQLDMARFRHVVKLERMHIKVLW